MAEKVIMIDGSPLTCAQVVGVARHAHQVALSAEARRHIEASREIVDGVVAREEVVYGVNTGFGSMSRVRIPPEQVRQVQRNLIRSHAAGIGEALPGEIVRATMLIMAASLSRGHSGVRPVVVETLIAMLNAGVTPRVPSRGSVGASGDLAPLSHIAHVLIGEGLVNGPEGEPIPGREVLAKAGIEPVVLDAKEGLALINGTHLMTAMGALMVADAHRLLDAAIGAAALSIDACRATDAFLDVRVHEIRRQNGQKHVAELIQKALAGSTILPSHKTNDPRVQDPYSLRCTPQVLGAASDLLDYVTDIVERELGAVSDNPLVFENGDIISAGNFHGMPLAMAHDCLSIAIAHIAGISERRVYYLLSATDNQNPINAHLSPHPGLHSGLMIAQYTAAAACNEIQTLAAPASVHNIPTSAGMEDYNSMGVTAAHQAWRALDLARHVIAIELLCSAEALEYQRPLRSGDGVEKIHTLIRQEVPRLTEDRPPTPDIEKLVRLIREGAFGLL